MPSLRPLGPGDPERIGDYLLGGVLGEGGQGIVYRARTPAGTQVAIKMLHARMTADFDARKRLLREVEIARRIAPFCTARVLDMGLADDRPYVVSEYIPGISLDDLVKSDGPRTGSGLHRLAVATLTALSAIHRAGIVHRDVKPGNVILGPEGPVVIDFGISRVLEQVTTRSGAVGTPAYMAPEQFEGRSTGAAADVFSWAAMMVFAATGHLAFPGPTLPAVMHAIMTREPDLRGVPDDLRPLLSACLDKRPDVRPGTADLLSHLTHDDRHDRAHDADVAAVLSATSAPTRPRPPSAPPGTPAGPTRGTAPRRHPRRLILPGGLALLAVAVAVLSWLRGPDGAVRVTSSTSPPGTSDALSPVNGLVFTGSPLGKPLTGHTGPVNSVAVGQLDGETVAVSGGDDGTVRVWDAAKGRQLGHSLKGHVAAVRSVAVGRLEGRTVAVSADNDGTVRVWDLVAGRQVGGSLTDHANLVRSVAVGQLGGRTVVVSAGGDGTVRVRDAAEGRQLGHSMTGHVGIVNSVAVGRLDGKEIAVSGGDDSTVRVWDLPAGRQLGASLTGHTGSIRSVAVGRLDGKEIAVSAANDGTVRVWDLVAGRQVGGSLTDHANLVRSVAVGQLGGRTVVVCAGYNRNVQVWDPVAGRQVGASLTGHTGSIRSVAVGRLDGKEIAVSAGEDGTLRRWNLDLSTPSPSPG
ncbi:protein kinase [Streptosporangium sp. NPDC087985]|uniref:protein kinase domain-containing protein n=1 Tax=Streptosporangium sp. NPDC087985 TaxID=3366196 RepID=UPI003814F73B